MHEIKFEPLVFISQAKDNGYDTSRDPATDKTVEYDIYAYKLVMYANGINDESQDYEKLDKIFPDMDFVEKASYSNWKDNYGNRYWRYLRLHDSQFGTPVIVELYNWEENGYSHLSTIKEDNTYTIPVAVPVKFTNTNELMNLWTVLR